MPNLTHITSRFLASLGLGGRSVQDSEAKATAVPSGPIPLSAWSSGWTTWPGAPPIPTTSPVGGPHYLNPVVGACIQWLQANFPVPDLIVAIDGGPDDGSEIDGHPLTSLLDRPNALDDFFSLTASCVASHVIWGESILLKRKDGRGKVLELWWLDPTAINVVADPDRSKPIDHYTYYTNNSVESYDPSEIIHIRARPDPDNPRRGLSLLAPVRRSIRIIDQAAQYDEATMANTGAAPGVFAPVDPKEVIPREDVEYLRNQFQERQTGRNAGKPIFSTFGIGFTKTGFSPEELALDKLPRRHVSNICAAIGLSPMVLGFEDNSKTYANYAESARSAYQNCLMPMQARWAEAFNHDPDLIGPGERAQWDYSGVNYLQDDRGKKVHALVEAVAGGILTTDEARAELNYPPKEQSAQSPVQPTPESLTATAAIGDTRVARLIAANMGTNGTQNGTVSRVAKAFSLDDLSPAPTDDDVRRKTMDVLTMLEARLANAHPDNEIDLHPTEAANPLLQDCVEEQIPGDVASEDRP